MPRALQIVALAVVLLLASAPAQPASAQSDTTTVEQEPPAPRKPPRKDPNLLTQVELSEYANGDALSAVRALRPRWLSSRGSAMGGEMLLVYVNGSRVGGVAALRDLQVRQVESLRFLDPGEATQRYGTGHSRGVIQARLRS